MSKSAARHHAELVTDDRPALSDWAPEKTPEPKRIDAGLGL